MRDCPTPLFAWPLLVVVLVVVAALLVQGFSPEEKIPVPNAGLPALHLISQKDVTMTDVSEHDLGDSILRKRKELVGRVTRTALTKGEPVSEGAVTEAAPKSYRKLVPVAFRAESSTAGDVGPGEAVTLWFAPTSGAGVAPLKVSAVLIDSSEAEAGGTDYVVAVKRDDRAKMLGRVARSRLLVTPRR